MKAPRYITGASLGDKPVVRLRVVESLGAGLYVTEPTQTTLRTRRGRQALAGNSARRRYQLTTWHGLFTTSSDDIESLRDFAVALVSLPGWSDVVDATDAETAVRVWSEINLGARRTLAPQANTLDKGGES